MSAPFLPWYVSLDDVEPWRDIQHTGFDITSHGSLTVGVHGWLYGDTPTEVAAPAAFVLSLIEQGLFDPAQQLRGALAILIADKARRTVRIFRDPLGTHPIFYARTAGRLVFSDSTRTLRAIPGVSGELNRAALADHLCHRWPDPRETFFKHIRRITPGSSVTISGGSLTTSRYWDPAPDHQPVHWAEATVARRFPVLFDQAVDRCLCHGPAAVFLSGGLDSISVAAVAADRTAARRRTAPLALSLAIPDPSCDERATQRSVASTLSLPLRLVEFDDAVGSQGLVSASIDVGRDLSSPLLNVWAPAYLSLARQGAAAGVRAVLSGSGGDEWLSVTPYISADLMSHGDVRGWWRFLRAFSRSYRHSLSRHIALATWTYGLRPLASRSASRLLGDRWERRRHRRMTTNDPHWIAPDAALRRDQEARASGALDSADPKNGFYLREIRTGLDHPLTSWELEEQYEFGRKTRQRFVHPYWDPDLVDILYRTPPSRLLEGGRAKGLIRGNLARRFASAGLDRQRKVSGTIFYRRILQTQLPRAAKTLGACSALADLGIIRADAAKRYAQPDFGSATNRWDLINLESWVRANG